MVDFREITERVTIRDILVDAGLSPTRNRIACPIHDGNNPTAFSFTDSTFICFACGAKGGLLALAEYLHHCSRCEAMRHLCRLAGIPYEEPNSKKKRAKHATFRMLPIRRDPLLANEEYRKAKDRLEQLELLQYALDMCLRLIRASARKGRMPLATFYAREQIYLYELEGLDPRVIEAKSYFNRIRRGLYSNDKNPRKHCRR